MKTVELYARVRHAVLIEGISERAAADRFGINARTVSKMLKFSVPPGYVRTKPPFRPKLDEFTGVIDAILAADKDRPKKQRHTSKRIFERLRDEHGFSAMASVSARVCSASCNRTTYSRIGLAARARVTTRARSRGSLGMRGGTSSCRSPCSLTSRH